MLHAKVGSNFSHYKRATVIRRIGRQMQVNGIEETADRAQSGKPVGLGGKRIPLQAVQRRGVAVAKLDAMLLTASPRGASSPP